MKKDEEFVQLVTKVGELLGYKLEVSEDRPPSNQMLVGPDDQRLFLSNSWAGPGRLHVQGRLPMKDSHTYTKDKITVDIKTTPEKIARAIERRLLPSYLAELAEAKANLQKQADRTAWIDSVLRKFERSEDSKRGREAHHVWITRGDLTCCVDIGVQPDDVSLNMRNVPERLALKIVALLRATIRL